MPLRRIVISGCSGGGKSTLIDGLAFRGFHTVAEAGRMIVRQELKSGGRALPWVDPALFAERLARLAIDQFVSAVELDGPIFFDRCVIEPLVYSTMQGIELPALIRNAAKECRYDDPIFLVPPWERIFVEDSERRHSFVDAIAEYDALFQAFVDSGYDICVIPQMAIEDRIDLISQQLDV